MLEGTRHVRATRAGLPERIRPRAGFLCTAREVIRNAPARCAAPCGHCRVRALGAAPRRLRRRSARTQNRRMWDSLRAASVGHGSRKPPATSSRRFCRRRKSEVSLYASHYLGPWSGRPLAEVRATLAARPHRGPEQRSSRTICPRSKQCECVAGDAERHPASIADQRAFFERHLMPWVSDCCAAILQCPIANYYRKVASFTSCFLALERDSFAIE
jgi:hypothetical protein